MTRTRTGYDNAWGEPPGEISLQELDAAHNESMQKHLDDLWKAFSPVKSRYDHRGKRTRVDFTVMLTEAVLDLEKKGENS